FGIALSAHAVITTFIASAPPKFPFFFGVCSTTDMHTLSLHDALPISARDGGCGGVARGPAHRRPGGAGRRAAAALRERRRGRASARRGHARGALECRGPLAVRQQGTPSQPDQRTRSLTPGPAPR